MDSIWSWLKEKFNLFALFWQSKPAKVLFLGLANAGKTSLMGRLKEGKMMAANPTLMPHSEELTCGNINFTAYDLGGHKQARRVWLDYFPVADAIVFLIDASDIEQLDEACVELQGILNCDMLHQVPVAVLLNKIDKEVAINREQLIGQFGLQAYISPSLPRTDEQVGAIEVFPCSILQKQGYGKAFVWLTDQIK